MADFWKSQGRKYCDFCKCWIADNKPSIEFHEGGKKHKENVQRRIKEIHKNSAKQMKQTKKFENDIKNMENAAMQAYLKDLEGNQMVDLTAQQLIRDKQNKKDLLSSIQSNVNPNRMPEASPETNPRHKSSKIMPSSIDFCDPTSLQRVQAGGEFKQPGISSGNRTSGGKNRVKGGGGDNKGKGNNKKNQQDDDNPKSFIQKLWYEAKSPEGWTYYWHIETNETSWEIPSGGVMTIAEQEEEAKEQAIQAELLKQLEKEELVEKADIIEEQRANAAREKLKEFRKNKTNSLSNSDGIVDDELGIKKEEKEEEEEEEKIPYRRDYSVPNRVDPYGPWQTVEIKPKKVIDLQLPERAKVVEVKPKEFAPFIPIRKFEEKTVTKLQSGDSDGESSVPVFKKRKFGSKNVRKRFEDDD